MKVYFFIKNDRLNNYQNTIDISNLDYLKKGIFSQLSKYYITEIKMLREESIIKNTFINLKTHLIYHFLTFHQKFRFST